MNLAESANWNESEIWSDVGKIATSTAPDLWKRCTGRYLPSRKVHLQIPGPRRAADGRGARDFGVSVGFAERCGCGVLCGRRIACGQNWARFSASGGVCVVCPHPCPMDRVPSQPCMSSVATPPVCERRLIEFTLAGVTASGATRNHRAVESRFGTGWRGGGSGPDRWHLCRGAGISGVSIPAVSRRSAVG